MKSQRIYCSGPLFCAEEVGGMSAIARVLEKQGFATFLPHRDGIESYVMRFGSTALPATVAGIRTRLDYAIFALDVYELLECCDAVVCNLNGRVPDEGMIVEAAIAYAAGKPLVLFKDDARAPFGGYDNSMLTSLVQGEITGRIADIPAAVRQRLSGTGRRGPLSADLEKALAHGRRIAAVMARLPAGIGRKQWSDDVIDEVVAIAREAV